MNSTKKSLFDYFKTHNVENKFIYEIENSKKKSFKNVIETVSELRSTFNFNKKKVLCILPNNINYIEFFFAVTSSGGIFIPIPYFTAKNEIKKILKFIGPDIIVTDYFKKLNFYKKKIINIKNLKLKKKKNI